MLLSTAAVKARPSGCERSAVKRRRLVPRVLSGVRAVERVPDRWGPFGVAPSGGVSEHCTACWGYHPASRHDPSHCGAPRRAPSSPSARRRSWGRSVRWARPGPQGRIGSAGKRLVVAAAPPAPPPDGVLREGWRGVRGGSRGRVFTARAGEAGGQRLHGTDADEFGAA
eukprot:scaffold22030_cov147-Isochrysis_galbana.AAC.2